MIVGSIARRYARALLEIGVEARSSDALQRELEAATAVYVGSKQLSETLENPVFVLSQRRAVLEQVAQRLALSRVIRNFLLLLLDRGRIAALPAITREHRLLVDVQQGRVRARVTSARPLPADLLTRLKATLERQTGKAVLVETAEDPLLIGGVVTQIGDLVFDGSLRTQLETLREQLLAD